MSTMSELAATVADAKRCATIGCPGTPMVAMVWHEEEGLPVESICDDCHDSYIRRPSLTRQVTFLAR
jgi:hypothetical protein